MIYWGITLFGLGICAFLDFLFNYGGIFRGINSVLFMLVSLGLLIRTRMMMKTKRIEKLTDENAMLKNELNRTTMPNRTHENEPELVSR
jgi:hypothetical protein